MFEVHSTFTGRMALNRINEQNLIAIVAAEPYKSAISAFEEGTSEGKQLQRAVVNTGRRLQSGWFVPTGRRLNLDELQYYVANGFCGSCLWPG